MQLTWTPLWFLTPPLTLFTIYIDTLHDFHFSDVEGNNEWWVQLFATWVYFRDCFFLGPLQFLPFVGKRGITLSLVLHLPGCKVAVEWLLCDAMFHYMLALHWMGRLITLWLSLLLQNRSICAATNCCTLKKGNPAKAQSQGGVVL